MNYYLSFEMVKRVLQKVFCFCLHSSVLPAKREFVKTELDKPSGDMSLNPYHGETTRDSCVTHVQIQRQCGLASETESQLCCLLANAT